MKEITLMARVSFLQILGPSGWQEKQNWHTLADPNYHSPLSHLVLRLTLILSMFSQTINIRLFNWWAIFRDHNLISWKEAGSRTGYTNLLSFGLRSEVTAMVPIILLLSFLSIQQSLPVLTSSSLWPRAGLSGSSCWRLKAWRITESHIAAVFNIQSDSVFYRQSSSTMWVIFPLLITSRNWNKSFPDHSRLLSHPEDCHREDYDEDDQETRGGCEAENNYLEVSQAGDWV